jgi:hypothetical protein
VEVHLLLPALPLPLNIHNVKDILQCVTGLTM